MFNFVRKLFKALNSSGKPWQLSAAVVLAMFVGFLPSSSLILLDLLLIALVLNINFGLFLLFSVIFSGLGYLFDPIFERIGYALLTNESLNGFFTALYNSLWFKWSGFNYTLTAGSLAVSSILALPLFFGLNHLISLYRDQIGQKLNTWKLTRWMKLFNEEAVSSSIFRWWALGVYAVVFSFIVLFVMVVFDPLAKFTLEKSLSYALQTQVSIKEFDSKLRALDFSIKGIEIADKDKLTHNLAQVQSLHFDLDFLALVDKKWMIENLDVDVLAFDVKRTEAASAYWASEEKAAKEEAGEKSDKQSASSTKPFELPKVDDILAKEELRSITQAQVLKKDIEATQEKWDKVSKALDSDKEVEKIQSAAKKLQQSLKGADIQRIASASQEIKDLKEKIATLKAKYTNLQKEFKADKKRLKNQISQLKDLPEEDYKRLKKKYALSGSGASNLVGTLINKQVGSYMHSALKYYEMIKPYLSDGDDAKPQEVTPPRGQGRWIKYANHSNRPELLIKKAEVNLALVEDELDIEIEDLSSNQKLYGKPMRLHADAKGKRYQKIVADVIDDRREDSAKTDFDLKLSGFKKEAYDLEGIQMKDIILDTFVKGDIVAKEIDAKGNILLKEVAMQMPSQAYVNELISSIHSFNTKLEIKGDIQSPSIKAKSDLDKQLSKGLKKMASKQMNKFSSELKSGIVKKAGASSSGLSSDLGDSGDILKVKQDELLGINLDFSASSNPLKGILPF